MLADCGDLSEACEALGDGVDGAAVWGQKEFGSGFSPILFAVDWWWRGSILWIWITVSGSVSILKFAVGNHV